MDSPAKRQACSKDSCNERSCCTMESASPPFSPFIFRMTEAARCRFNARFLEDNESRALLGWFPIQRESPAAPWRPRAFLPGINSILADSLGRTRTIHDHGGADNSKSVGCSKPSNSQTKEPSRLTKISSCQIPWLMPG